VLAYEYIGSVPPDKTIYVNQCIRNVVFNRITRSRRRSRPSTSKPILETVALASHRFHHLPNIQAHGSIFGIRSGSVHNNNVNRVEVTSMFTLPTQTCLSGGDMTFNHIIAPRNGMTGAALDTHPDFCSSSTAITIDGLQSINQPFLHRVQLSISTRVPRMKCRCFGHNLEISATISGTSSIPPARHQQSHQTF
jgi:hypothetical protein